MAPVTGNPSPVSVLLPHRLLGNVYVRELGRAYQELGCDVFFGPENFFESNVAPDILHINWPEDLYRAFGYGGRRGDLTAFARRLDWFKERGSKLVWTVHNEKPHEGFPGVTDSSAYQLVIDAADVIHHHCDCSRERLEAAYEFDDSKSFFIAPHGHYFAYPNTISRDQARRKLGINERAFVYLHFGAIRGYKGIEQVMRAFRAVRESTDHLLVAGRLSSSMSLRQRISLAITKRLRKGTTLHLRTIESDDIQIYLNAADCVVLGHTQGLNSGVAILGLSFGRPVIGPELGCIPAVLRDGPNLLYSPGNVEQLKSRMREVREVDGDVAAEQNRALAATWEWRGIAEKALEGLAIR